MRSSSESSKKSKQNGQSLARLEIKSVKSPKASLRSVYPRSRTKTCMQDVKWGEAARRPVRAVRWFGYRLSKWDVGRLSLQQASIACFLKVNLRSVGPLQFS